MNKNSSLFNSHYLRKEKDFIQECRKRDLYFDVDFLEECKNQFSLKPVLRTEGQSYYDIFQIPVVAKIYRQVRKFSEIKEKVKEIKKTLQSLETILPLLYEIRYFYQDELYNMLTTGIIPPFKLTEEEVRFFDRKFTEIFNNSKSKYKPRDLLKKYRLNKKDLLEIRSNLFHEGYFIDPMAKWYSFLKTIRIEDRDKFKRVEKSVLLAHDYYLLAELITLFYRDAIGDEIIDPEDMFDLTGGKWKFKNCEGCGKKIRIKNHREKYCLSCKRKIVAGDGVKSKCYKCGKPFYKYIDGDEMVNKFFKGSRKSKESGFDTVTNVKLHYGRMTVYTQCECGAFNYYTLEKGWF